MYRWTDSGRPAIATAQEPESFVALTLAQRARFLEIQQPQISNNWLLILVRLCAATVENLGSLQLCIPSNLTRTQRSSLKSPRIYDCNDTASDHQGR